MRFPAYKLPTDYTGNIYLDWIADSDYFGYLNYKSLESLLIQYPEANFQFTLIAPGQAQNYKIGNLISSHFFQKYLKMGYQLRVQIEAPRGARLFSGPLPPGFGYWREQLNLCCSDFKGDFSRRIHVPLHTYFYRRVLNLYNNGGLYSDFSWYHRQPLDMFTSLNWRAARQETFNGIVLKDVCRPKQAKKKMYERSSFLYLNEPRDALPHECYTSTLMAFNKGNKVLHCVLEQYDSNSTDFRRCIAQADAVEAGNASHADKGYVPVSECMRHVFHECFVQNNAKNDFLYLHSKSVAQGGAGSTQSHSAIGSSGSGVVSINSARGVSGDHDHFTERIKLVIRGVVGGKRSDRFLQSLEMYGKLIGSSRADHYDSIVAAAGEHVASAHDCAAWWTMLRESYSSKFFFDPNKKLKHAVNMAQICGNGSVASGAAEESIYHQQWHEMGVNMREKAITAEALALLESVLYSDVVWIGSKAAYSDEWLLPQEGSIFDHFLAQHQLPKEFAIHRADVLRYNITATNRIRHSLRVRGQEEMDAEQETLLSTAAVPAATFEEVYEQQSEDGHRSKMLAVTQPPCHHYHVKEDAPAALKRQASTSCAPHFMVPGFMKAGSTAIFQAIMTHPQMVHNLRGVVFKETGCYFNTPDRQRRMFCFPHVEESEHLYFGDGTVWYANQYHLAEVIAQDNPNVRVIFTVRDRVKRTESHHRFTYFKFEKVGVGNLNVAIDRVLDRSEGQLMDLYDLAVDALQAPRSSPQRQEKLDALVARFFRGVRPHDPNNVAWNLLKYVIINSIYLPSIYMWCKLLPRHQIMVVRAEDYSAAKVRLPEKLAYLQRALDMKDEFKEFKAQLDEELAAAGDNSTDTHARKMADLRARKMVDDRYMTERMNDMYR